MIPDTSSIDSDIEEIEYNSRTYYISDNNEIQGIVEDMEALKQAVKLILNTERYAFPIYSWDYGIELVDLFGQPLPYVKIELKRRIEEALLQDDRISEVKDFEYSNAKGNLLCSFTVVSDLGNTLKEEIEVSV